MAKRDILGALGALMQAGVILRFDKIKSAEFGGKNTCTAGRSGDKKYHIFYYNKITPWGQDCAYFSTWDAAREIIEFCGRDRAWEIAVENQRRAYDDGILMRRVFNPYPR